VCRNNGFKFSRYLGFEVAMLQDLMFLGIKVLSFQAFEILSFHFQGFEVSRF
jgi:hypothetical protein